MYSSALYIYFLLHLQQRQGSVTKAAIINNEEIKAGITKYNRFEGSGTAVYGGVNDPRMGANQKGQRCRTCNCTYERSQDINDCPGHFGHIELARPVYHVGFIDDVVKILRCVCFHCSKLLIDPSDHQFKRVLSIRDPQTRLRCIHDLCKAKKKCNPSGETQMSNLMGEIFEDPDEGATGTIDGCGMTTPKYTRQGLEVEVLFPKNADDVDLVDNKQKLSALQAYNILRKISDDDVRTLGLDPKWARPEWLIVSVLPVPPPHVRPTIDDGAMRAEDDLTHMLMTIVKDNMTLENAILNGEPPSSIDRLVQLLQFCVTGFFDNERPDMARATQRSGRPLKAIKQRLKGKEGRIRGNLMGKRVDFSARTVITADPNLSIDQVGVPRSVATRLTVPITVTPFNIQELTALVAKGPFDWPGARYIIRANHERMDLRYVRSRNDLVLEYGWIVERHLRDDDIILFNRQPSLHKMSIMGHRAKVLHWSTFRLNLSVTTPYNADFDGDEMNLHVPQSINARADAEELMMVPRNIVTPQSNRNVMGIVQDSLLALSRYTKRDVFLDREMMMNCVMWIDTWDGILPAPAVLKPKTLWTGKQLFSMVCPKINYKGKSKVHEDVNPFNYCDSEVLIHEGELLQGIMDKNIVGTSGGSIVHICWLQEGWKETRRFMNQVQTVSNYWMATTSYTVSVSDTVADSITMTKIQDTLDDAKDKVRSIMERGQSGELKGQPGKSLMEIFENNVNMVLNAARETTGKAAQKSLKNRNAIKGTVLSGSKGSFLNITQIIGSVGQQNVQGKRIGNGFNQRTLPHFAKDDLGMVSRGFVENSYLRGLTPNEFFFHAMGGREGLIDTAVKTSETGYIQRRLVKAMESVMARYDGTLRNSYGCVMQFLFGEDGMDAQKIEKQRFDCYDLKASLFKKKYYLDFRNEMEGQLAPATVTSEPVYFLDKDLVDTCLKDMELHRLLDEEYDLLCQDRIELREILATRGANSETDGNIYLPCNVARLIWNAQRKFRINKLVPSTVHPRVVLDTVRDICDQLIVVRGDDVLSREAQYNATLLFKMFIRSKLSTKRVLKEFKLTEAALMWLKGEIVSDFRNALVNPGEMCGVMAAQSIGEPATQMTLNTFHNSGISAKNVTLGVPRLNEILNVAKGIRTPYLTIYLKEEFADDNQGVEEFLNMEYTTLGDLTTTTEIHFDPDPSTSVIEEDRSLVEDFLLISVDDVDLNLMSPWVLRIMVNSTIARMRKIEMEEIATQITEKFVIDGRNTVHVIYSQDNEDNQAAVLRVRFLESEEEKNNRLQSIAAGEEMDGDDVYLYRLQKELMETMHLRGVPGIKKVSRSKSDRFKWSDEGGFEKEKEWLIDTDGSNLAAIFALPMVDHVRTVSNDIVEMFNVLGVEGARSSLFRELHGVLSFDSSYVNYRHIACLADCMTFSGHLMAVSRHGINRGESGPLLRASFEETVEVLMQSAMFSQVDVLNGVTENIMLGQLARVGTGMVDLLLDFDKLKGAIDYGGNVNSAMGKLGEGDGVDGPHATPFQNSPTLYGNGFGDMSPSTAMFTPSSTPFNPQSPAYMIGQSPGYLASSSVNYSTTSPAYSSTPDYSPTTPGYSPTSPAYSPTSPAYSPTSPAYSPMSASYSPTDQVYSPTSPAYSVRSTTSSSASYLPEYSPTE